MALLGMIPRVHAGLSFTRLEPGGEERFVALRRALGVSTFGLNQIVLAPGQRGRVHRHERQEEVYLVLEGVLSLVLQDEERDLARGELARVAPDVRRQLVNRGPDTCVLLAIGGAEPHEGRDGIAYSDWDDTAGASPQSVGLPEDLPAAERRSG